MKIRQDTVGYIHAEFDTSDETQTYGGESTLYNYEEDPYDVHIDYSIGFEGDDESIHVTGMNITQYKTLGLQIINHLMTNGHSFEIKDDRMGNGEYLSIKH